MEIDTAVRHKIPVLVVISNNGGWTADAPWTRPCPSPAATSATPATTRSRRTWARTASSSRSRTTSAPRSSARAASGKPAVVNVITDYKARAQTVRFSAYTT